MSGPNLEVKEKPFIMYSIREIAEYIITIVGEFAKKFNLTELQAYRYIHFHKGIDFIETHYGIMHTLDFQEAIESVALYCRKSGGLL